jgi:hypothetical protein
LLVVPRAPLLAPPPPPSPVPPLHREPFEDLDKYWDEWMSPGACGVCELKLKGVVVMLGPPELARRA